MLEMLELEQHCIQYSQKKVLYLYRHSQRACMMNRESVVSAQNHKHSAAKLLL